MNMEISHKQMMWKNSNIWKLNRTLFYNSWIKEEVKEEVKGFLETNENKDANDQNLWNIAKAIEEENS